MLGALALADYVVDELSPVYEGRTLTGTTGLLGWDAAWYRDIAQHGYADLPDEALRFFPFVPLLARLVGVGAYEGAGLLIVSNACALGLGVLMYVLVVSEGRDAACARRAAWLTAVFPAAFVLVMGYAEATMMLLAVAGFLALRRHRWLWAALAFLLAGLTRPTGLLLAIPATVEVAPGFAATKGGERMRRVAAVLGAPVGLLLHLGLAQWRGGDWTLPVSEQLDADRAGSLANPVSNLVDASRGLVDGDLVGTGLHVPWVLLLIVLAALTFRYWPPSYGAFAVSAMAVGIASSNLDSVERYGMAVFPILLTGAVLTERPIVERVVLLLSAGAMTAYSTLAFLGLYVP